VITGFQMGRFERKRQLGIFLKIWEGNFKMDPQEIEWLNVDYIHVGLDRGYWWSFVKRK
jgi:hypothetical protein